MPTTHTLLFFSLLSHRQLHLHHLHQIRLPQVPVASIFPQSPSASPHRHCSLQPEPPPILAPSSCPQIHNLRRLHLLLPPLATPPPLKHNQPLFFSLITELRRRLLALLFQLRQPYHPSQIIVASSARTPLLLLHQLTLVARPTLLQLSLNAQPPHLSTNLHLLFLPPPADPQPQHCSISLPPPPDPCRVSHRRRCAQIHPTPTIATEEPHITANPTSSSLRSDPRRRTHR